MILMNCRPFVVRMQQIYLELGAGASEPPPELFSAPEQAHQGAEAEREEAPEPVLCRGWDL